MRPQQLMMAFGVFMIGTIFACIASGRWLLNGEMDIFNALASFNVTSMQAGGVWSVPKNISTYWTAIITALTWNYPYLSDGWVVFLKIPLWLVSMGVVWGLFQFAVTVVQGLVGAIRNII